MRSNRSITCTNKDGDTLTFREDVFLPFVLVNADDVYDAKNNVNITENTMTDGAIYQGSTAKYRNIVLTLQDISAYRDSESESDEIIISSAVINGKTLTILDAVNGIDAGTRDYVHNRSLLDKVFKRNEPGTLLFREDEEERAIDYYVESMTSTGANPYRTHTISLICPDPFFYDPNDIVIELAQIVADFEFIHEFSADGEELGHNIGLYNNIYNESANENIGLTIEISGATQIINPIVTRMESNEFIQIGDEDNPFTLDIGEKLIITTGTGNKHVYYLHGGTTEEINYKMADGSSFIQLMRGNNNISYNALFGKNGMKVLLTYRMQYARA